MPAFISAMLIFFTKKNAEKFATSIKSTTFVPLFGGEKRL
jgi:hypothetical protein